MGYERNGRPQTFASTVVLITMEFSHAEQAKQINVISDAEQVKQIST